MKKIIVLVVFVDEKGNQHPRQYEKLASNLQDYHVKTLVDEQEVETGWTAISITVSYLKTA